MGFSVVEGWFLATLISLLRSLGFLGALGSGVGLTLQSCQAQSTARAVLTGTVTDATGAVIAGAAAHLTPVSSATEGSGPERDTDRQGSFIFAAPPGRYVLTVEAPGFATYASRPLALVANGKLELTVHLQVASLHQEINIQDDSSSTDPNDLSNASVFEGKSLDLLSNDPTTLQQQLNALAGGTGTPRFSIDGFAGGRLPPKASIRSIRINRNPYSAYFADLGFGRVEISTKPGIDQLHGHLNFIGTDQPLDARNPYTPVQPPFYDFQQDGDLNGPLNRKTAFFLSEAVEVLANTSAVNAVNPAAPSTILTQAVPAPQRIETFALRVDRQFSRTNFGYVRDEWNQVHVTNSGIVPLVLPSAAYTANTLTNTFQLADTQILSAHAVNEARFQYLRTRVSQDPNSTLPSLVVEGSFQAGGSAAQTLRDNQDVYEVQDLFDYDRGHHAIRAGLRVRALRDANQSSAGFNGQYIFPDLPSYLAGQPTQYSLTTGQQSAVLSTDEVALYAEDDWKVTPNITFSYGLRFESQTAIPDHSDPAPRIGIAWAVRPGKRKSPVVTLRAGYGLFYDRFPAAQLLQSVRQNGTRQVAYFVTNPTYNPAGVPPDLIAADTQPTVYRVDPSLKSSYAQAGSLTAVRSLGRFGSLSANMIYLHNAHNFLTKNVNAPLPGTFNPSVPGSGVRPLGTQENVYQFSSSANANLEQFFLLYRLQLGPRVMAFGRMYSEKNFGESDGITSFASNSYDVRADYGPLSINRTRAVTSGLDWALPHGFDLIPFVDARSGIPFNITTGTDLNGDSIYNDRPSLGVAGSAQAVATGFGTFNPAPSPGEAIRRNSATSAPFLWLDLQVSKDVRLGPRPAANAAGAEQASTPRDRPWDLKFILDVQNLTNHNNPGQPVGVLGIQPCSGASGTCAPQISPLFGHSLSLANDFSPNTASNRTILLQTSFTF